MYSGTISTRKSRCVRGVIQSDVRLNSLCLCVNFSSRSLTYRKEEGKGRRDADVRPRLALGQVGMG